MKCQYYLRESVRVESKDPAKPGSKYVQCFWCKHEFSPAVRKAAVAAAADGGRILNCEGDLAKCELPAEHRLSS